MPTFSLDICVSSPCYVLLSPLCNFSSILYLWSLCGWKSKEETKCGNFLRSHVQYQVFYGIISQYILLVCNSAGLVPCHSNAFLTFSIVWMYGNRMHVLCVVCPCPGCGGTHLLTWHLVTRDASSSSCSPWDWGRGLLQCYTSVCSWCGHWLAD